MTRSRKGRLDGRRRSADRRAALPRGRRTGRRPSLARTRPRTGSPADPRRLPSRWLPCSAFSQASRWPRSSTGRASRAHQPPLRNPGSPRRSIPFPDEGASLRFVTAVGDRLVVTGSADGRPLVWYSDDEGATWSPSAMAQSILDRENQQAQAHRPPFQPWHRPRRPGSILQPERTGDRVLLTSPDGTHWTEEPIHLPLPPGVDQISPVSIEGTSLGSLITADPMKPGASAASAWFLPLGSSTAVPIDPGVGRSAAAVGDSVVVVGDCGPTADCGPYLVIGSPVPMPSSPPCDAEPPSADLRCLTRPGTQLRRAVSAARRVLPASIPTIEAVEFHYGIPLRALGPAAPIGCATRAMSSSSPTAPRAPAFRSGQDHSHRWGRGSDHCAAVPARIARRVNHPPRAGPTPSHARSAVATDS